MVAKQQPKLALQLLRQQVPLPIFLNFEINNIAAGGKISTRKSSQLGTRLEQHFVYKLHLTSVNNINTQNDCGS